MRPTTPPSSLLVLTFIAAAGTAYAQPEQAVQQAPNDQAALEQVVEWVGDDATRIQAAMEQLGIAEPTDIIDVDDPFAGTYQLKQGFIGKPRVTVTVLPNDDGTYEVRRVHDPRWGDTVSLIGTGQLGKETITGKTRLLVDFGAEQSGAAGALNELGEDVCPEESPRATYKIDAETGRISGTFYDGEPDRARGPRRHNRADDVDTGAYESGWRVGAVPMSFTARTKRSASIMASKIRAKLGKVRASLAERMVRWRDAGLRVKDQLVAFMKSVKDRTVALAGKAGDAIRSGANRTGDAVKSGWHSVRNRTADAMDWTGDRLHDGAERVRVDDEPQD